MYNSSSLYNAHVRTFGVALGLNVDWRYLRVLPKYRDFMAKHARRETAKAVRALRKSGQPFPAPGNRGIATGMPAFSPVSLVH